jgi:hypothetical protein
MILILIDFDFEEMAKGAMDGVEPANRQCNPLGS